jgi:hypothetical protein
MFSQQTTPRVPCWPTANQKGGRGVARALVRHAMGGIGVFHAETAAARDPVFRHPALGGWRARQ